MKIKIIDFLMAIGEICNGHVGCKGCPLQVDIGDHHGCAIDGLHKKEIAQKVKEETIKYMLSKERSKDE